MDSIKELDVIIIGAGFAGICALIKMRKKFPKANIAVFEKGDNVGGTWAKNTYPALSCDIPSQLYSYSFALNPDWSTTYASQPEILSYIQGVVASSDCSGYIHLKQECVSASWLEDEFLWRVNLVDRESGRTYVKHARSLITAVGFCDVPNGPEEILGFEKFQGHVFHSARWDHACDFNNKRVAVVGNGCSANQFIPALVNDNRAPIQSLVQFVRSPHWIAPKEDGPVSSWKRWAFRNIPLTNRLWRYGLALKLDLVFMVFKSSRAGNMLRSQIQKSIASHMKRVAPPEYHSILVPEFDFGAKRPVLDHGYLQLLHDERVKLVRSPSLAVVGPRELRSDDGETFEADILILANGFKTQMPLTPMKLTGSNGLDLPGIWQQDENYPSAYMGVSVTGFPNLFLLTGPNTLPSGHSTLVGIECSVTYISRVLERLFSDPTLSRNMKIEATAAAQKSFNDWIQRKLQSLVYSEKVPNWYIDRRTGRNTLIWPGSQVEFWWSRCIEKVKWSDFQVEARG
ncbi:related to putative monooxygenase [Cephalotrichum gorgonifer]|uniref:Related to putative monooxygenase n=1 Tax=Cephalotrichum gorgonifer TaxID=2041049 RepID=A0AAE8N265_9PEZI|nr:related to putative monooxygenase [Cephalotrichum gorgonifer]